MLDFLAYFLMMQNHGIGSDVSDKFGFIMKALAILIPELRTIWQDYCRTIQIMKFIISIPTFGTISSDYCRTIIIMKLTISIPFLVTIMKNAGRAIGSVEFTILNPTLLENARAFNEFMIEWSDNIDRHVFVFYLVHIE